MLEREGNMQAPGTGVYGGKEGALCSLPLL